MDVCNLKKRNLKKSLLQRKEAIHSIRNKIQERSTAPPKEEEKTPASKIDLESEWSSSDFDETKIYGWDEEVKAIYGDLKRNDEELNTVGIVGMFGAGKTKLAQKVFADGDVVDRFSLRLWVWVSKSCSRNKLLRRMLDNLGVEEVEIENALAVDTKLREEGVLLFLLHLQLLDKRYLIVFDDVRKTDSWYCNLYASPPDNDKEWDRLAYGLPKGSGGAIIVTSRSENDARKMVGRGTIHTPKPLSVDHGWQVFKEAYETAEMTVSQELLKMKELIIGKCAGLPLALKVAGRELQVHRRAEEKKGDKAADSKEEKGKEAVEKEEKVADDGGERGKEPLQQPEKKGEEVMQKEMPREAGEKGKEPPRPPAEEEKEQEAMKKEMSRSQKQEEKSTGDDEKERGKEPPPPLEEKKDKEAAKEEMSPHEKEEEKPTGGDEKEKGKEPPPPGPPLEEKKDKEAAPPLEENKDKEAMLKETSTGDGKGKGREPEPPLAEKKDRESMRKDTSAGDGQGKGKESAPQVGEEKDKEGIQKEMSTGDGKEKGEELASPLDEKKEKEDTQMETSTGDEKEKGKEPAPPLEDKKDKEPMQKETPPHETVEGKPAGDEKDKPKELVAEKQGST